MVMGSNPGRLHTLWVFKKNHLYSSLVMGDSDMARIGLLTLELDCMRYWVVAWHLALLDEDWLAQCRDNVSGILAHGVGGLVSQRG